MLFAGAVLTFSLFAGCKQGNGDRCEIASDCSSNYCIPCSSDPQNLICSDPTHPECPTTGAGGAVGSIGGASGTGGVTGAGGTDAATGVTTDSAAADSGPDTSAD